MIRTELKTVIKSSYVALGPSFKLLLGQKLDSKKSDSKLKSGIDEFSSDKSFSGRFTDVNMFRGILDDTSIENFANCRPVNGRSVIVDWNVNAFDGNEIDVEDLSTDELCSTKPAKQTAVFNHGTSHAQLRLACEKLGGVRYWWDVENDVMICGKQNR